MGFSRQEYWVGGHALLQGIFSTQGLNPSLMFPALTGGIFTTTATWEASYVHTHTHVYTHVCKGTNTYAYLFLNGSDITLCICFVSTEKCILDSIPNLKLDQTHSFCQWHSFPMNDGKIII